MILVDVLKNGFSVVQFVYEELFVRIRYNEKTIAAYYRKKGALIGEDCVIQSKFYGIQYYLLNIGNHVFIANEVILHTHDGATWIVKNEYPSILKFGKIIIEDNCLIGARAQILPNVRVGSNSIIGAGSVIIADIPANSVVMGVPGRVIGSSQKYKEKCIEIWNKQTPPGYENMTPKQRAFALKKHLLEILSDPKFDHKSK